MGWKTNTAIVAGAVAAFTYVAFNIGDYRGDKDQRSISIGNTTARIARENRQFAVDTYRVDILDEQGNKRMTISYLPRDAVTLTQGGEEVPLSWEK